MRQPPHPARRRILGRTAAGIRKRAGRWARSPKAAVLVGAALLATAFAVTPAYADDPGLNCALTATASISVSPSPVVFGQNAQVQWSADGVNCFSENALQISGPGFNPSAEIFPVGGGSRSVFIGFTGTAAWDVTVLDLSSDTGFSRHLASVTASVTGVTVVPDLVGDTQAQARQELSNAGYVLGGVGSVVDCDNVNRVSGQNPAAGTPLVQGSSVSVTIGRKPTPPRQCQ
ncbi:PASTA domain-containing protein [Streptomyces sp. NBC_01275]|uniref:PASTA domain-containing protein n=1 Tax=Streptomyces sp. NBC_01275 TaxID=2903807 RepID=UPI002253C8EA|nr:PASTA domain-containing protein [Streptomyces sp. NBC_01275]MCX4765115.1 PASTA domain-containing protein [Streptomyces sp. NBC_01275]